VEAAKDVRAQPSVAALYTPAASSDTAPPATRRTSAATIHVRDLGCAFLHLS